MPTTRDKPSPSIGAFAARLAAALQNGLEIARFGGLGPREASPHAVVASERVWRLRRYFPDARRHGGRPAALLVPPLMLTAEVWDVAPESSAVASLSARGIDPWVIDFGAPEKEEGGLERTLADHVVAVSEATDRVRAATGRDVHLVGYSQGGMFCYQAAAYRRSEGVASIVGFGSPVDAQQGLAPGVPSEIVARVVGALGRVSTAALPAGLPAWATRAGFRMLDPVKDLRQRAEFFLRLYDREALLRREGMRRFLWREGWVAYPGPALRDLLEQVVEQNRMLSGGLVIDGRALTLADVTCPILAFVGETDTIAPPATVRAVRRAAPRAQIFEVTIPTGHFGLVVGSRSAEVTWPVVADWLRAVDGGGERPERARPMQEAAAEAERGGALAAAERGAELAWSAGREILASAADLVGERVGLAARISRAVLPQVPRLARLEGVKGDTRIGLGRMLEERAQRAPDATFFLFEGRAYSYAEANRRVDAVVRGLLACGVRQGDAVGVLMGTRPSALALATALSRLGAVAALLRPDAPLAGQLELAGAERVIADPEHAELARRELGDGVLVLGGGGRPRALGPGLVDMEAIEPRDVRVPEWYEPNPGTAEETALVLLTGPGERLRASRITNRRLSVSALGTASACALTARDTVYCCAPIHHATGILVCVGGALAGGSRLAVASRFEPKTFWDEVRRYGASVVFYTGAMCRPLVGAPPDPAERHHPVRLFAGSGMPAATWRRLLDRFGPVSVVEFYASTEANAVLVNLSGEKIGSVGRPLPGGAELALAAYDAREGRRLESATGFARPCPRGGVGLLLARVERERGDATGRLLRGVFRAGDAWISTGDLFRVDADGDFWLADHAADVVRGREGPVFTIALEDVLGEVECVDLAAAYGVELPGSGFEIPVAAIALRAGHALDPKALRRTASSRLPREARPRVLRVLDDLPTTAGHRLRKEPLRREGVRPGAGEGSAFWLEPGADAYTPFDARAYERLQRLVASGEL